MSRRQKRKSIRTMLLLGVSGTALASLVATLVYAYSPRLANWQLSPQEIAEADESSPSSAKNGWTSRLVPPLPAGEGNGSDTTVPTSNEIQVAALEPGADTVTTGTGEGNPSTGGPGSVGGTFEQTYGNGPQFGGMGGQGGSAGFGGPNGPGGNNARPMAFGAPSSGPGGPSGPSGPPSDPPPGKSPDGPNPGDPEVPSEDSKCIANCEIALVPPGDPIPNPGNPLPQEPPPGLKPPGPSPDPYTPPGPGPGPNPYTPPFVSAPACTVNCDPPPEEIIPPVIETTDCVTNCGTNDCVTDCGTPTPPASIIVAVPEPGALALFLMGLAGIGLTLLRRRA